MQVLDRLDEVRLPDHDIDIVRLVDGHHIPGKRRRGHMHMLPQAHDSHVRCSECEQSSLRAPRSPLGVPRTAPHHGGARSPARHPLSPPGEGDVEHVYLGAEAIEGAPMTTQQVRVDGVDIAYTDTGSGPTILFVHGVYVTGALWNDVVSELGGGFRCVVPTWPLGAHSTPTGGADIGAEATARRIVHFIEALDLRDVTVVANDTGGGLVLTALGDATLDKSRIGRLVLTNCDSYEHFPPGSFAHIVQLCRLSSTVGGAILRLLATGPGQSFFLKAVCRNAPAAPERRRDIFGAFATSSGARRDAVRVTASLDPALTLRAAPAIEAFDKPVTLVWGAADRLFPLDHARRLLNAFPQATLDEVPESSTFVMLDAPRELAAAIRNS
jgi:pimeloyl-ACP methyl ester carboxylesterase